MYRLDKLANKMITSEADNKLEEQLNLEERPMVKRHPHASQNLVVLCKPMGQEVTQDISTTFGCLPATFVLVVPSPHLMVHELTIMRS